MAVASCVSMVARWSWSNPACSNTNCRNRSFFLERYAFERSATALVYPTYSYLSVTHSDSLLILRLFHFNSQEKFSGVDIRVRVNGGGHVAQIYAIRQAISKALVAYYQKCKTKASIRQNSLEILSRVLIRLLTSFSRR